MRDDTARLAAIVDAIGYVPQYRGRPQKSLDAFTLFPLRDMLILHRRTDGDL